MNANSQIRVLRSLSEALSIEGGWRALSALPENNWDMYWSSLQNQKRHPEPYVVAVEEHGQLRSALLGRIENGHVNLSFGYMDLLRIPVRQIVVPMKSLLGPDEEGALAAMIHRIVEDVRAHKADVAVYEFLEEGSALHRAAKELPVKFWMRDRVYERRIHHYVNLPTTFKEYHRSHKGLLQKVRKFERTFEGRFEHRMLTREDEIEAFCRGADAVASSSYQRALGVGFLNSEEDRAIMLAAARAAAWRAFVTLVDGQMIAFWSGCEFGSLATLWWTGYDAKYQEFSPGLVASARMVEQLIARGITRVDFGGGDAAYKERLADEARWEETVCIYAPTLKGAFANGVHSLNAYIGNLTRTRLKGLANRIKTPSRRLMASRLAAKQDRQLEAPNVTGPTQNESGGSR